MSEDAAPSIATPPPVVELVPKKTGNRFVPGQSGNPLGRKPGGSIVRELLEPKREELIAKAIEMALGGSTKALEICIDRLAPPARAEALHVRVPALQDAVGLDAKAGALIDAVGTGDLDVESATRLLAALADAARISEFATLAARLDALEGKLK